MDRLVMSSSSSSSCVAGGLEVPVAASDAGLLAAAATTQRIVRRKRKKGEGEEKGKEEATAGALAPPSASSSPPFFSPPSAGPRLRSGVEVNELPGASSSSAFPSLSSPLSVDPLAWSWMELEAQIEQTLRDGRHQGGQVGEEDSTGHCSTGRRSQASAQLHSYAAALRSSHSTPLLRPAVAAVPSSDSSSSSSPISSSPSRRSASASSPPQWLTPAALQSPELSDRSSPPLPFSPSHSPTTTSISTSSSSSSSSSSWCGYSPSASPAAVGGFACSTASSSPSFSSSLSPRSSPCARYDSRALLDQSRLQALALSRRAIAAPSSSTLCLVSSLCRDVLYRVLCMLDVPSLCVVSCVCRVLKVESEAADLWAELVAERWPVHRAMEDGRLQWKAEYQMREEQERVAFFASLPVEQQQLSHWQSLYSAQLSRQRSRRRVSEFALIRAYRDAHSASVPSAGHSCSFLSCRFDHLQPDLLICRASHAVHFCSSSCHQLGPVEEGEEGVVEGRCAVSGRWPSSLHRSTLQDTAGDEGDDEGEAGGGGDGGVPLAYFLLSGYEDEEDGPLHHWDDGQAEHAQDEDEGHWTIDEAFSLTPQQQHQHQHHHRSLCRARSTAEGSKGKKRRRMQRP